MNGLRSNHEPYTPTPNPRDFPFCPIDKIKVKNVQFVFGNVQTQTTHLKPYTLTPQPWRPLILPHRWY